MLEPEDAIADRWIVQDEIGSGTFCEVYRAVERAGNTEVAVKVEKAQMNVLKWEQEVLYTLQSLECVPRHLYYGQHRGRDVLVMELVDGEDVAVLRARVNSGQGLPLHVCVQLTLEMLGCLEAMHGLGFVHRDVKPANFLRRYGSQTLYVIDFGIAKGYRMPSGEPREQRPQAEFRGTTSYASQRVLQGRDFTLRDDMWSLLYVFLDLFLGKLPWAEEAKRKDKETVAIMKGKLMNTGPTGNLAVNRGMGEVSQHLDGLGWAQRPDYGLIRAAFRGMLTGEPEVPFNWEQPARSEYRHQRPRSASHTAHSYKDSPRSQRSRGEEDEDDERETRRRNVKRHRERDRAEKEADATLNAWKQKLMDVRNAEELDGVAVTALSRCRAWMKFASGFLDERKAKAGYQDDLNKLEDIREVADAWGDFFEVSDLKDGQLYLVQQLVYKYDLLIVQEQRRPPPLIQFDA